MQHGPQYTHFVYTYGPFGAHTHTHTHDIAVPSPHNFTNGYIDEYMYIHIDIDIL